MKIKELLNSPEKWTKGVSAIDNNGKRVSPYDEQAICFCLAGAVHKCYNYNERDIIRKKIMKELNEYIIAWNDKPERTFEEVKALVEKLDI